MKKLVLEVKSFFGVVCILFFFAPGLYASQEIRLESVVVTANKSKEDSQEVSSSITVFTEKNIEDLKIENVADIAAYTPNFMLYEMPVSGTNAPSIRGLYADIHSHSVSAGLYVDGVPVDDGIGYTQDIIDVERIEVLKGPQGTLYGKSAEGGVVNIITKKPDNSFRGKLSGDVGLDNKRKFSMALSGPVKKDLLYFGIAGLKESRDGWVEDVKTGDPVDDTGHWYGNAKLRFTPSDSLDLTLGFSILKYDEDQPHQGLNPNGAAMYNVDYPGDGKVDLNLKGKNKSDLTSQYLNIHYQISDYLALDSITAYRKFVRDHLADWDFVPATYMHCYDKSEIDKLSQEIRLSGSNDKIKYVFGIYGDKDTIDTDYWIEMPEKFFQQNQLESRSGAAFLHASFSLSEKLILIGGLRYDYLEKEYKESSLGIDIEDDWNEISPKAGIEYKIIPGISMVYATVSKGYLSGGFNPYSHDLGYLTYDEEKLYSYEAGIKNTFFDKRLSINAALYYMDIDDIQVQEEFDGAFSYTTNAAKASGKGAELEISAVPLKGLSLNAGLGYNVIEFDRFSDAAGNYKGNKKPYSPEYSFNIGAQYRTAKGLYFRGDLIGYGDIYTDKGNKNKVDAYETVNGKIGYETENFDFYVYGKNIFDKNYDSEYHIIYTNYSRPAEAGFEVAYRF